MEASVVGEDCSGHGQALPKGSVDSLHLCLSCREPPSTRSHPFQSNTQQIADEAGIEVQQPSGPYKNQLGQATCAPKLLVGSMKPCWATSLWLLSLWPILLHPTSFYGCQTIINIQSHQLYLQCLLPETSACHKQWARERVVGDKFRKLSGTLTLAFTEIWALESLERWARFVVNRMEKDKGRSRMGLAQSRWQMMGVGERKEKSHDDSSVLDWVTGGAELQICKDYNSISDMWHWDTIRHAKKTGLESKLLQEIQNRDINLESISLWIGKPWGFGGIVNVNFSC